MRHLTLTLLISLFLATALTAQAQENKTPEQKVSAPTTITATEKPKNEVEKMIAKVEERGDSVVGCRQPCNEPEAGEEHSMLNGEAISLPMPAYPPIARAAHAQGAVDVQVLIDYDGKVIAASVISGHPLLQTASLQAARKSLFKPTKLDEKPVMVTGIVRYNFALP
jgi:TonB family protein